MRKTRSVTNIGIALTLAASMTACGSDGGEPSTTAGEDEGNSFPEEPITLVVPFPPGGLTDITTRLVADAASGVVDEPVSVSNVEGGSGTVAMEQVVNEAEPDGYTLAMGNAGLNTISPHLGEYAFDGPEDYIPITHVASAGQALLVLPDAPWNSLEEFVQFAEENPGGLKLGAVTGSMQAMLLQQLNAAAGVDITVVPFQGGADVKPALLGGHIDAAIIGVSTVSGDIEANALRPLAVFSEERDPLLPDVPTATEEGIDVVGTDYFFLLAPQGTPDETVQELRGIFEEATSSETFVEGANEIGLVPGSTSDPEALMEMLKEDYEAHGELLADL